MIYFQIFKLNYLTGENVYIFSVTNNLLGKAVTASSNIETLCIKLNKISVTLIVHTEQCVVCSLMQEVKEIKPKRKHEGVTDQDSFTLAALSAAHGLLFHCSASFLSANVLHSGSSVNYSTSQEGRGS